MLCQSPSYLEVDTYNSLEWSKEDELSPSMRCLVFPIMAPVSLPSGGHLLYFYLNVADFRYFVHNIFLIKYLKTGKTEKEKEQ